MTYASLRARSEPVTAPGALPDARPASPGNATEAGVARCDLRWRTLVIVLGLFSAISAIGPAIGMIVGQGGSPYLPPIELLEHTPFRSLLVPGLILGGVVGGTSLACAILAWRRSRAALDATILAGGTLTVWIIAEAAMLRAISWLHIAYGALGTTILLLGLLDAWRSQRPRHRWVIAVTFAETIGYLVPACAGILSTRSGLGELPTAGLVVAAGFVEGFALGTGQSWAFPLPVRRLRYALLTALGAGVVWLTVMSMMTLARSEDIPPALTVVAGIATAVVGLASIGSAQWIELRHHARAAHRWIAWTALAWIAALPLSFTPSPFVDESTPIAAHVALWACGGLLMAYVMALVTWQGARRMSAPVLEFRGHAGRRG